jgi:hypothetical protein
VLATFLSVLLNRIGFSADPLLTFYINADPDPDPDPDPGPRKSQKAEFLHGNIKVGNR